MENQNEIPNQKLKYKQNLSWFPQKFFKENHREFVEIEFTVFYRNKVGDSQSQIFILSKILKNLLYSL